MSVMFRKRAKPDAVAQVENVATPGEQLRRYLELYTVRGQGPNGCWRYIGTSKALHVHYTDGATATLTPDRLAFLAYFGHVEDSLVIFHACGDPSCIRPEHMASVAPVVEAPQAPDTGLLSHWAAADLIGTTPRALLRAIRARELNARFVSVRAGWRIARSELLRWASASPLAS